VLCLHGCSKEEQTTADQDRKQFMGDSSKMPAAVRQQMETANAQGAQRPKQAAPQK